jgi:hypothetical protein
MEEYTYYAFISYKHEDEHWAKWLQKKLESYRLPSVLQKQYNLKDNKITPIFRDKTDLSVGTVRGALQNELNASKFLIVISSPRSAASKWVDFEVESFIRQGREKHIIPFITSGEPNAETLEKECFTPALLALEEQLLGISVKELGKNIALMRVIAGLLEIRADELIKREKTRMRKRQAVIGSLSVFGMALLLLVWSFLIPHDKYYTDYVLRYGVPEGIFQLSKKEIKTRNELYVITKQFRRVVRLMHTNSALTPTPLQNTEVADRPMIAQFSYENGQISTVKYLDRNDRVIRTFRYSANLKAIDFTTVDDSSTAEALQANITAVPFTLGNNGLLKSNITRFRLEYDENGFIKREQYMRDNRNTPASDTSGIFGIAYTRDNFGRVMELQYLDENDALHQNKLNVRGKRYAYDASGHLIRTEFFSPEGTPTNNEQGWMICEATYNQSTGNETQEYFLNSYGSTVLNDYGYPGCMLYHDEKGNRTQIHYCGSRSILGIYGIKYSYDKKGQLVSYENYGRDGEPSADLSGIIRCDMKLDKNGNILEWQFLDGNGKHMKDLQGVSKTVSVYENGAMIKQSYFDASGNAILCENGYHSREIAYKDAFTESDRWYYGLNSEPIMNKEGYSHVTRFFDDRGNFSRIEYYGLDGQLLINKKGYAINEYIFDEVGNLKTQRFFDAQHQPCLTSNGCHEETLTYDRYGNGLSSKYLGTAGNPVINERGYSCETRAYDKWGNVTQNAYFGTKGEPVASKEGFHSRVASFAGRNASTEIRFLDTTGQLMVVGDYARATWSYGKLGFVVETCFFGADNTPHNVPAGFARIVNECDANGKFIRTLYYDKDGLDVTEQVTTPQQ